MNLLDVLGEIDTSDLGQTIRYNNALVKISDYLSNSAKLIIYRLLDLAEVTFNGLRIPRRTIHEYDNEPYINIQIEKFIIGLIQQRNSPSK